MSDKRTESMSFRPKKIAQFVLTQAMRSDALWRLLRGRKIPGIEVARQRVVVGRITQRLRGREQVQSGPFMGLSYPSLQSSGSVLVAKLLGTYESELHPAFDCLLSTDFSTVVDVGCAEGFYAVGLARIYRRANVQAYDINPVARALCERMAAHNGTGNVTVLGECGHAELLSLDPRARHLVVCDCEGFEGSLFTAEIAAHLRRSTCVIEIHDEQVPGVGDRVGAFFTATHDLEWITSLMPEEKERLHTLEMLKHEDEFTRSAAVSECRGQNRTRWIIAWARSA